MFCKNCGNEVNENAVVCLNCGAAIENENNESVANQPKKANAMAITGFVLGLVALFLSFFCIVPTCALVFSILGFVKRENYSNKGLAIAGLVISIVAFALDAIFLMLQLLYGFYLF